MKYIVSISDRNYVKYARQLFLSLRRCGWRGPIILVTPDENVYCNETVIQVEQGIKSHRYKDCRWLMFDLYDLFKKGDQVMYIDADCTVDEDFPVNSSELWDHDFALTKHIYKYDKDRQDNAPLINTKKEVRRLVKELVGREIKYEYIATPWVFKIGGKAKKFFDTGRMTARAAVGVGGGIVVSFTTTCIYAGIKPYWFDHDLFWYPYVEEEPSKKYWLYHYGGRKGKELWEREHEK